MAISAPTAEKNGNLPARSARIVPLEKARLVAAILVIAIHTNLLVDSVPGGFLVPHGIARLAVPYFAIMTGYFTVSRGVEQGPSTLRRWAVAVFRAYLVLFALYAPFFALHMAEFARAHPGSPGLLVVQALRLILLKGYVLHLWYLPCIVYAAYLGTLAVRALRGVAVPLALALLVYVGASVLETWWWATPGGTGERQIANARMLGELGFLIVLVPFVLLGCAIRRLGDRFPVRAAWWGLAGGTVALLAESTVVWAHGGASSTLLSLLVVAPCGFRVLLSSASASGGAVPYAQWSSLIYYYHLFPLMALQWLNDGRPIASIPLFLLVTLATAAMAAVTMPTRLAKLLT